MVRRPRPAFVVVNLGRWPHRLNLREIDRAYYRGLVAGRWTYFEDFASDAKLSRSTVARFLAGQGVAVRSARAIITALDLRFEDVAVRCEDEQPLA